MVLLNCVMRSTFYKKIFSEMESEEFQAAEDFFSENSVSESLEDYEAAEDHFTDEDIENRFVFEDQIFVTSESVHDGDVKVEAVCCENLCMKLIQQTRPECREDWANQFAGSKIDQKNKVLQHLKNTSEVEMELAISNHNFFFFQQTKFCPKGFSEVTKISVYMLNRVREDFVRGRRVNYEHGNRGKGRMTLAGSNFVSWILDFSEKYAQASPDELLIILPKIFIVTEMYRIYEMEVQSPRVKKNSFYKLFKNHFGPNRRDKKLPRIRISKYSSHSKCDVCVKLIEARKSIRTVDDMVSVRKRTEQHRKEYSEARIEINRVMQLSQSLPRDYLGIEVDDMDNSKSMLPRCVEKAKSMVGMKTLKTKISGCIIKSGLYETGRKTKFFLNHDQFENASDKMVTELFLCMQTFLEDHKFLPGTLVIAADNCWLKRCKCHFPCNRWLIPVTT